MQPAVAETPFLPAAASAATSVSPRVARGASILVSILAHVAMVAAVLYAPAPAPKEPEPLVRLVFAEPPPPPPPPPAVLAPVKPVAPVVEKKPKRIARKPKKKPVPVVEQKPVELPPPVEPAPPEPEVAPDPAGVVGGVAGGVEGGTVGGVVGGRGSVPVPAGQVARPPLLVKRVTPEYPVLARRRGIEGLVRLEAVLDREGHIEEPIRVLESVAALDEAAIDALREWRFAPARDDRGDPVRVILEVPIRFVLR